MCSPSSLIWGLDDDDDGGGDDDDDDGGGGDNNDDDDRIDNYDDDDTDDNDNADDASHHGVSHEGAVELSLESANPVEGVAVHRLVLLCADEGIVEDEPLRVLLVPGYHLNLNTIQVLDGDAEVLLLVLVRLLV